MTSKPKLLIFTRTPSFHLLLRGLRERAEFVIGSEEHDPSEFELMVIDGEDLPAADMAELAKRARVAIEAKRAVLLLHASTEHKAALADAGVMSIHISEPSAALMIEPRFTAEGELTRGRGLVEQFFPLQGELVSTRYAVSGSDEDITEIERTRHLPAPADPVNGDYANFAERLALVVDAIAAGEQLSSGVTNDDGSDPMQPPPGTPANLYLVTDLLINRNWTPTGSKDKNTETPPPGHMSESGHVQVGVYYDNTNTPPQHWIKVLHSGNLQTGGLVHNSSSHRGWSLADYEIKALEQLEGTQADSSKIAIDQVSPTNVNGVSQYTSSSSFSVGVQAGTDGINAPLSYQISSSSTINVADWTVAQIAPAYWQFYQQNPYDGRSNSKSAPFANNHKVLSLPQISMYGTQYNAQSVWVHNPASSMRRSITYSYATRSNYAAYNNGFWAWHTCVWHYDYSGNYTLEFDFSKVQPSS